MKKVFMTRIVAVVLALLMMVSVNVGLILSLTKVDFGSNDFAGGIADRYDIYKETGGNLDNDKVDTLKAQAESMGWEFGAYKDEAAYESYKKSVVDVQSSKYSDVVKLDTTNYKVTQTFKVVDTFTENPIANAMVRVGGVPRYTDSSGKITLLLDQDYIELVVEKSDYNPYIEIIKPEQGERTIYLKHPNDDLLIYAVMLHYDGDDSNLLEQPYYVNKSYGDTYYAEIEIIANVAASDYYLLINGQRQYWSNEPKFYDFRVDDLNVGDSISVEFEYNGILSKRYVTYLVIDDLDEAIDIPDDVENTTNPEIDDGGSGIFVDIGIDFMKIIKIKEFLKKGTTAKDKGDGSETDNSLKLSVIYNSRTGILSATIGFEYDYEKTFWESNKDTGGKTDKERYEEAMDKINGFNAEQKETRKELKELNNSLTSKQSEIDKIKGNTDADIAERERLKQEKKEIEKQINENKKSGQDNSDDLKEQCKNKKDSINELNKNIHAKQRAISDLVKQVNDGKLSVQQLNNKLGEIRNLKKLAKQDYTQHERKFTLGFEIVGVLEYNVKKNTIENISVSIKGSIGLKFSGTFLVWVIPFFYEVSIKFELKVSINIDFEEQGDISFDNLLEYILVSLGLVLRGTVGAGINGFLSLAFFAELSAEMKFYPFRNYDTLSWEVLLKIGIKMEALFFNREWGWEWKLGGHDPEKPEDKSEILRRSSSYKSISKSQVISGVYQESRAQISSVDGVTVMTFIKDSVNRDSANRTILMSSVLINGVWSTPVAVMDTGEVDVYHNMYYDGVDLHLTWQKANRELSLKDDIVDMGKTFDICYAVFDKKANKFGGYVKVNSDSGIDFAPQFAIKEKASDSTTIVWQRNSADDIFGFEGVNSVCSSTLSGGVWSNSIELYKTDNYISFVTSAIKGGKLSTAMVEYRGDIMQRDTVVRIVDSNGNRILSNIGDVVNNTKFSIIDGQAMLMFYGNDNLAISPDLINVFKLGGLDKGVIGDNFSVCSLSGGLAVFYEKVGDNGQTQGYYARLDYKSREWTIDIQLTNESYRVYNINAFVNDSGQLYYVYNVQDSAQNTVVAYAEKQLLTDFEITNIIYDKSVDLQDSISTSIWIDNIGDTNLKEFTVIALNQKIEIVLSDPIGIGQMGVVKVDLMVTMMEVDFIVISNGIKREYTLDLKCTDMRIEGAVRVVNNKQTFDIIISNVSSVDTWNRFVVRKGTDILYDERLLVLGNTEITLQLEIAGLDIEDIIIFEVVPEIQNKYANHIRLMLRPLVSSIVSEEMYNPYYDIMQRAKEFLV